MHAYLLKFFLGIYLLWMHYSIQYHHHALHIPTASLWYIAREESFLIIIKQVLEEIVEITAGGWEAVGDIMLATELLHLSSLELCVWSLWSVCAHAGGDLHNV